MTAFDYLQAIFGRRSPVRISPNPGRPKHVYRLREPGAAIPSYVQIALPRGFVVNYDGNLKWDTLLEKHFYVRRACDFILVNEAAGKTEIFLIEMKSNSRHLHHVVTQLKAGIAFVSFCLRHAVDKKLIPLRLKGVKCYAVMLTHTTTIPRGTGMAQSKEERAYRDFCSGRKGIVYVQSHSVTLEQLKSEGIEVNFAWTARNRFEGMLFQSK